MFPEAISSSFTMGISAQDAILSTRAPNVLPMSPIQHPDHSPSLLVQELPTPVNSDRLQFFLSGYVPSVAFNYGYLLHYEGPQDSS